MPKQQIDWQICVGLPTQCYRNLNNGLMSIRQKIGNSWLVVGHTDKLPFFSWRDTDRRIDRADYLIVIDNRAYCPSDPSQSQLTLF